MKRLVILALLALPSIAQARGHHDEPGVLLRQPDGSYEGVRPEGDGPFSAEPAYPGADWSPTYNGRGDRVGTIERQGDSFIFYDQRGDRR